jgi:hypothetical protein
MLVKKYRLGVHPTIAFGQSSFTGFVVQLDYGCKFPPANFNVGFLEKGDIANLKQFVLRSSMNLRYHACYLYVTYLGSIRCICGKGCSNASRARGFDSLYRINDIVGGSIYAYLCLDLWESEK